MSTVAETAAPEPMAYADYLRLEGSCALVLGAALIAVGAPGLEAPLASAVSGVLLAAILAVAGRRSGAPLERPGEWFTTRPLAGASAERTGLDRSRLIRRLLLETVAWVSIVCAWVLIAGQSHDIVFATGIASAAFGAIQAFAARRRVLAEEQRRGEAFVIAERKALGTPSLGIRR